LNIKTKHILPLHCSITQYPDISLEVKSLIQETTQPLNNVGLQKRDIYRDITFNHFFIQLSVCYYLL